MSKKNQNVNEDIFVDEGELNYYTFPPIYRYEDDETTAAKVVPTTPPAMQPITQEDQFIDPALTNIAYTQAFLKTLIGKRVRITFLIGTSNLTDRTGVLVNVGVSYVVIKMPESNTHIMCDLYSIKFVDYFD